MKKPTFAVFSFVASLMLSVIVMIVLESAFTLGAQPIWWLVWGTLWTTLGFVHAVWLWRAYGMTRSTFFSHFGYFERNVVIVPFVLGWGGVLMLALGIAALGR